MANSNSHIILDPVTFEEKRIGNQTECALLEFVNRSLIKLDRSERNYEEIKLNQKILKTFPFNSDTKKMTVAVEIEHDKTVRLYVKGASENIIDDCIMYLNNKELLDLSQSSQKERLKETVLKQMAQGALRTIAMGYKDITYEEFRSIMKNLEGSQSQQTEDEEEAKQ